MSTGPRTVAHKMVMDLAVKMADEVFEEAMSRDNELYRGMKAVASGQGNEVST